MEIGTYIESISNPLGRNVRVVRLTNAATHTAPLSATTLTSYTVPNGRLFYLTHVYLYFRVVTPSSAPLNRGIRIQLKDIAGNWHRIMDDEIIDNTTDAEYRVAMPVGILIESGEYISGVVYDDSPDGSVQRRIDMFGIEFDAY